jgi:hypothetical protein
MQWRDPPPTAFRQAEPSPEGCGNLGREGGQPSGRPQWGALRGALGCCPVFHRDCLRACAIPPLLQAARHHMRYTHLELDLYRPTHLFPLLAFQRCLLLARTLLSASMMLLLPLQTGRARLGASR